MPLQPKALFKDTLYVLQGPGGYSAMPECPPRCGGSSKERAGGILREDPKQKEGRITQEEWLGPLTGHDPNFSE